MRRLGITVQYAGRKQPYLKGKVERFFRTLNNDLFHSLPGTTGSTFDRKKEHDPKKEAGLTLHQLNMLVHKYLIDIYPHKWHRGIKDTPYNAFYNPKERFVPREPTLLEGIKILTCPAVEKPVHHYGIELFKLRFQHDALSELRIADSSAKVEVRYDPTDMTRIFVIDPQNRRIIPAKCTDPEMHGLTLWQVLAHNNAIKANRNAYENSEECLATAEEWYEVLGLPQALRPGATFRGKKDIARALTLPGTPAEQIQHAPLALDDPSTFHGGQRQRPVDPLLADYSHLPELGEDSIADSDLPSSVDGDHHQDDSGTDLDAFALKHNLSR